MREYALPHKEHEKGALSAAVPLCGGKLEPEQGGSAEAATTSVRLCTGIVGRIVKYHTSRVCCNKPPIFQRWFTNIGPPEKQTDSRREQVISPYETRGRRSCGPLAESFTKSSFGLPRLCWHEFEYSQRDRKEKLRFLEQTVLIFIICVWSCDRARSLALLMQPTYPPAGCALNFRNSGLGPRITTVSYRIHPLHHIRGVSNWLRFLEALLLTIILA
jgi:hypothetical protein